MCTSVPVTSFLIYTPNCGGTGEYFFAVRLRELIQKANAAAQVTLLARVNNSYQESIVRGMIQTGDEIWYRNGDPFVHEAILDRICLRKPQAVLQFPYPDPSVTPLLRDVLPSDVPFLTIGEYSGHGFRAGLGPQEAGIFVDEEMIAAAENRDRKPLEDLQKALSLELTKVIGPLEKGQFGFGYAALRGPLQMYIYICSELAFSLQKKPSLTLVLVGSCAAAIPYDLSSIEKIVEPLGALSVDKVVIVDQEGKETTMMINEGENTLRLVFYPFVENAIFKRFLLALTDIPSLVTGDRSFDTALSSLHPFIYEALNHKQSSFDHFAALLKSDIPSPETLCLSEEKLPSTLNDIFQIARYYMDLFSILPVWREKMKNLLAEKDLQRWALPFFATADQAAIRSLDADSRLCIAAERLARLQSTALQVLWNYSIPFTEAALACRQTRHRFMSTDYQAGLALSTGAEDTGLFEAAEEKIATLSPRIKPPVYETAFLMLRSICLSFHTTTLLFKMLDPSRIAHVSFEAKLGLFSYLVINGALPTLKKILESPGFFGSAQEKAIMLEQAALEMMNKFDELHPYFLVLRLLFTQPELKREHKERILAITHVKTGRHPSLADELKRPEYALE